MRSPSVKTDRRRSRLARVARAIAIAAVLAGVLGGCRQDMHDQAKYEAFERNEFFDDQRASRPPLPGTVARGHLAEDAAFYLGEADGALVATAPVSLDQALLARGRERYDIYCSPCHDRVGTGNGMIVERGYKQPPSLHEQRLRDAPDGYMFQAITNGFGVMPSYAPQIAVRDRWAIVAYIRALQLSQAATATDLSAADLAALRAHETSK